MLLEEEDCFSVLSHPFSVSFAETGNEMAMKFKAPTNPLKELMKDLVLASRCCHG